MATAEGNRKIAAQLKKKYGVDEHGRSIFHAIIGSLGGENSGAGYFKTLESEDPDKLKKIATKGGKTKRAKNRPNPSTKAPHDAKRPVA
jgi:general stress protein YciG